MSPRSRVGNLRQAGWRRHRPGVRQGLQHQRRNWHPLPGRRRDWMVTRSVLGARDARLTTHAPRMGATREWSGRIFRSLKVLVCEAGAFRQSAGWTILVPEGRGVFRGREREGVSSLAARSGFARRSVAAHSPPTSVGDHGVIPSPVVRCTVIPPAELRGTKSGASSPGVAFMSIDHLPGLLSYRQRSRGTPSFFWMQLSCCFSMGNRKLGTCGLTRVVV
jgi:hypothetical protein